MDSPSSLVSIVLPTYNGARFLADAIDSVLAQTYPYWELIIVDSYSDDATPDIISRYCARDVRITSTQNPKEPGRLPGALNAGFKLASGMYYTWLSDDNVLRPHALQTMVDYLDTHADIGLVYTDYSDVDAERHLIVQHIVPSPDTLVEKNIITPSFLYRAEVDKAIGGYRIDYFTAEDYDFWLRARSVCRFHPINIDCQEYRVHDGSLTAAWTTRLDATAERSLLDNLANATWMDDYAKGRAYFYLALLAKKQGANDRKRRYWYLAARHAPYLALRRAILAPLPLGLRKFISQTYVRLKMRFSNTSS